MEDVGPPDGVGPTQPQGKGKYVQTITMTSWVPDEETEQEDIPVVGTIVSHSASIAEHSLPPSPPNVYKNLFERPSSDLINPDFFYDHM
ncbi:hypothetical protein WOLCODRAFT_152847 [Wolfiporia cocos MD-104 SS10]|uniref:Uncharacterized protein n=1 Tax=Wolfiporia cocos (strain MD-104) TaxID=742152 RepID=A0A2H3JY44_WOLCO|nr:hypothetical protein WOLCODRAFT_152847 [Wolfiporia cocos MD-104 SS10]